MKLCPGNILIRLGNALEISMILPPSSLVLEQAYMFTLINGLVFLLTGLISFIVCYYYGPPKDERSLDLICWFIQLVALAFLYQSTQSKEVSIALVIIVFLSKFIIFSKALRIFTSIALLRW